MSDRTEQLLELISEQLQMISFQLMMQPIQPEKQESRNDLITIVKIAFRDVTRRRKELGLKTTVPPELKAEFSRK